MASERKETRKSSRKRKEKKYFGDEESENGSDKNIQSGNFNFRENKIVNLIEIGDIIGHVDETGGNGFDGNKRDSTSFYRFDSIPR